VKPLLRNIYSGKYIILIAAILLFALSFIFNTLYSNRSSVTQEMNKLGRHLARQQKDFEDMLADTALISRLLTRQETKEEFDQLAAKSYGIFLYRNIRFAGPEMTFWSEQLITPPPPEILSGPDGDYFLQLSNGAYYVIRKTLPADSSIACAMGLVKSKFFIETDYLPESFAHSKIADKRVLIAKQVTEYPV